MLKRTDFFTESSASYCPFEGRQAGAVRPVFTKCCHVAHLGGLCRNEETPRMLASYCGVSSTVVVLMLASTTGSIGMPIALARVGKKDILI